MKEILIKKESCGTTLSGEEILAYTMTNANGMSVTVLNIGCAIMNVFVPDKQGSIRDVTLGHPAPAAYETGRGFFGAFVGRYANRIKGAEFELDGTRYVLPKNNGENHLHGCLYTRRFESETLPDGVRFYTVSPDGEEGFPGNLSVHVTYRLTNENELLMEFSAETDAPTVVNFTNHAYFNLNGHGEGVIDDQVLEIHADEYLPCGPDLCPTGEKQALDGTVLDFRTPCEIGARVEDESLSLSRGYDHCYVLTEGAPWAARAYSKQSGITLEISTTQIGLQFYSGNGIGGIAGKDGVTYQRRSGFALEAQAFPCSPNYPEFPSTVLRPGEIYRQSIHYKFGII